MKKYIIRYITKDDNCCSVWTMANSKDEAIQETKREYWDIKDIISCREE